MADKKKPKLPTLRLTSRDLDILDALGSYRFLTIPQLTALFFAAQSTCEGRLRQLYEADLVVRVYMPVRPFDKTATTIYALGAKGAKLLAPRHDGVAQKHLTAKDRRSALFLDHTLRRNDVRICLELLDRDQTGFAMLAWKQTPDEVRGSAVIPLPRMRSVRVPIVPDGFFAIRWRSQCFSFCLEVDMGTVNTEKMLRRYQAYWRWWREGGAAQRFGAAPMRVLTMTTTESRLERLRGLAVQAPPRGHHGSGLFWFAHLAAADIREPGRLLSGPWSVATGRPEPPRTLLDS